MAASFNKVILVGTVGRDPEIRYLSSGTGVCKFVLAVNPNRRDAKPEDTLWAEIVAWDKLGETCNTYLKKGSSVLVEGRLVIRSYDDKDGNKRKATEIVIYTMQMLGGKREGDGDHRSADRDTFGGGDRSGGGVADEFPDGEIPF